MSASGEYIGRMNMVKWLKKQFSLPETADLELDDPVLSTKRHEVIRKKGFLNRIYTEWYGLLAGSVPSGMGRVLEIGAGGGFMQEFIPESLTSEVFPCSGVDMVLDACAQWPFGENELKAVLMVNVLHHLPNVRSFFRQAEATVRCGGIIAMVEPWVTPWSRLVYSCLHHEPFIPQAREWAFPSTGPLSGANSALPWIVFHRDKKVFKKEFPHWLVESIHPLLPFSYLLSGGVSMRSLCPRNIYHMIRQSERWSGLERRAAMFAHIVLRRV